MGIRVPIAEQQVLPNEGQAPGVPAPATPPPAAFGTTLAEAAKETGQTVERIGAVLGEHQIARERMAQKAQVIQADTAFRSDLQDHMFDPTTDENGIPKGVFNRQGLNAKGATEEFDTQHSVLRQKYLDSMQSPYQKQLLGEQMDQNYPRLRELVARHEGQQIRLGQDKILAENLQSRIDNAGLFKDDPQGLLKEIETGITLQHANAMDNGVGTDGLPKVINKFTKDMVDSALKPLISPDPNTAMRYLDKVKSSVSPSVYHDLQNEILEKSRQADGLQKYFQKKNQQFSLESQNESEADVAGKMANGEIKPEDLDSIKDKVSNGFYQSISTALKNIGKEPEGTPTTQTNAAVTLQKQFVNILGEDSEKKTKALMKFRSDVMASQPKLRPDDFNHLLGLSDPKFVAKIPVPKVGMIQAGIDFIKSHYQNFVPGGDTATAIKNFLGSSSDASVKPEDVPAHAQAAIKGDTLKVHPELVGHPDLSNNIVSAAGINQVTSSKTNLKPTQKIAPPVQFKPGDERKKGDVTYVRQQDGSWLPKR